MAECNFFRRSSDGNSYYCELPDGKVYESSFEKAMKLCTEYAYLKCKTYLEYTPSSICYLTTLTCEILGLPDNNFFLNQLRSLRDNYMVKDIKLRAVLKQYDCIGPIIGTCLLKESDPKMVAFNLFESKIIPISYYVCEHKYNLAVTEYLKMTRELIEKYNLDLINMTVPGEDMVSLKENIPLLGHGGKIKR